MTAGDAPSPARISVRWSEHEAHKSYARPFGVAFAGDAGSTAGGVAVSGADLLYYTQFQAAVLALAGELFLHPLVESAPDTQRTWLDLLGTLLPPSSGLRVTPFSDFDTAAGRVFHFRLEHDGAAIGRVEAGQLVSYQEFQAAVAHQSGRLFRCEAVEVLTDRGQQQVAWMSQLQGLVSRPTAAEAMSEAWPWR